jgi:hypothetical protein
VIEKKQASGKLHGELSRSLIGYAPDREIVKILNLVNPSTL